jgi:molybdopterin converting factor small subunit
MSVKVNYQGILEEEAGTTDDVFNLPGQKTALLNAVLKKHTGLKKRSFVVAINGTVQHGEAEIQDGDCITLIPPPPGG